MNADRTVRGLAGLLVLVGVWMPLPVAAASSEISVEVAAFEDVDGRRSKGRRTSRSERASVSRTTSSRWARR